MKYILKFNEKYNSFDSLRELVDDSLCYLLDSNYITDIFKYDDIAKIYFRRSDNTVSAIGSEDIPYQWNDIKSQFIPFLEIINDEYAINSINFHIKSKSSLVSRILNFKPKVKMNYNKIVNDDMVMGHEIYMIEINLKIK